MPKNLFTPSIALRKGLAYVKTEIAFKVKDAPFVEAPYGGGLFYPGKVTITDYGGSEKRANVQVLGQTVSGYGVRSRRFNLHGYGNSYGPCPEWLVPLVREAGYTGEIEEEKEDEAT